jgi:tetratricopeptide (TPR) repeat protein
MAADYEKAMAAYQRCIEIDRENHQPYNGLGNCFKSLAQFE